MVPSHASGSICGFTKLSNFIFFMKTVPCSHFGFEYIYKCFLIEISLKHSIHNFFQEVFPKQLILTGGFKNMFGLLLLIKQMGVLTGEKDNQYCYNCTKKKESYNTQ